MSGPERDAVSAFAEAALLLARCRSHAPDCKFAGCTCGAAEAWRPRHREFARRYREVKVMLCAAGAVPVQAEVGGC